MQSQSYTNQQYRGITKTVCIGLGGTGRDVLVRLRRLIVERYGKLNNLPVVSFVHIDTDKGASRVTGLSTGSSYQGEDLSFRDYEIVNAQISAAEVDNFIREASRGNRGQPGPYDHISQWFPAELLQNVTAIDQGAKGIRPVGRLAFFWNFRKIQSVLRNARQQTEGKEQQLLQEQGLIVDPGLNIFIVGSLCGGTGSGMFLDMAYSLRNAYEDIKVIGYFVISPELYGNHPRMSANAYAALMELDYYSRKGTTFEACFDQQNLDISTEKRPPFDSIYLVSNKTENNEYTIHDQGKLCNVIANKIALDFVSELAPKAKSNRDNFDPLMMTMDRHPRPNCQHYMTFGMSAIYFPQERIAKLVTNQIKAQLLAYWLEGVGQSADPKDLLDIFLIDSQWQTGANQQIDAISRKLEAVILEGDKNFSQLMNSWRSKVTAQINRCNNRETRNQAKQILPREFRDQFRKVIIGETEATRGSLLTKLKVRSADIVKILCKNIDDFIVNLLSVSDINFSIINARNWMSAVQAEVSRYQQNVQERNQKISPSQIDDLEKKWKQYSRLVDDHEKQFHLFGLGRNGKIQDDFRQAVESVAKIIKGNYDLALSTECLVVLKELQQHIQNRSNELTVLRNMINSLKRDYERDQEALEQLNLDEMSGIPIYDANDVVRYCNILLPDSDRREQLIQLTKQLQDNASRDESLATLLSVNQASLEQIKYDINTIVEEFFGSRINSTDNSVISRFNQTYPSAARSAALTQVIREAQPLIPFRKDLYFDDNPAKRSTLIGFRDSDEQYIRQFKSALLLDANIDETMLTPIQSENQIIFVNEYAAFPLRFINDIDKFKLQYIRAINSSSSFLHNDRRVRFTDIIPPDVELMQGMEEIFFPCIALDIIRDINDGSSLEFSFYDSALDEYEIIALTSDWTSALEILVNRHDLKSSLEDQLNSKLSEISKQPDLWKDNEKGYRKQVQRKIGIIRKLPKDDINFDHSVKVAGAVATTDVASQEGILARFIKRVDNLIINEVSSHSLPSTNLSDSDIYEGEYTE